MTYYFEKCEYIRNQNVFREGDVCSHVYIVYKGEFEVIKKMKPVKETDGDLNTFLGPKSDKDKKNDKSL